MFGFQVLKTDFATRTEWTELGHIYKISKIYLTSSPPVCPAHPKRNFKNKACAIIFIKNKVWF